MNLLALPLLILSPAQNAAHSTAEPLSPQGEQLAQPMHTDDSGPLAARAIETGSAVIEHGGGLVAIGHAWKAYFDDESVRIVPRLGREAPADSTLELRLDSIRRGASQLDFDAAAWPSMAQALDAQQRVSYSRSGQVAERFEVRDEGLELALDFQTEVGTQGDLVVRYEVESGLAAREAGSDLDELRLENAFGGLRIGGVTGIDADGVSFPGRLSFDGEHLELTLPAAHVDRARWPLTLDPLIGPEGGVGPEGSGSYAPAISFDAGSQRYLVAWIAEYSLLDWDVVARQLLPDGTPVGGLIGLEVGQAVFSTEPAIGNVRGVGKWAVAWTEFASLFGSASAKLRAVRATDSQVSPELAISPGDSSEVDVGGTGAVADSDAVVVWRAFGQGVQACEVNLSGAVPTLGPLVQVSTSTSAQRPSISRTPGQFGRYLIAWDEPRTGSPTVRALRHRSFDADLGQPSAESTQLGDNDKNTSRASVDGDGRNWYVSYISEGTSFSGQPQSRARTLRVLEKPGQDPTSLLTLLYLTPYDQHASAMAFTGTGNCLFGLNSVGGDAVRAFVSGTTFSGYYWPGAFVEAPVRLDDRLDAVATYSADHEASTEVRCVWAGADGQVWFGALDAGVGVTQVDAGCGAPASNRAGLLYPSSASGACVLRVEYDGDLPGLLALSSLGFSRADFPCGPCLLVPNSFGPGNFQYLTTDSFGDAEFSLVVPSNPALTGFTAWHQWFTVDPLPECGLFGVDASPALELVVQ